MEGEGKSGAGSAAVAVSKEEAMALRKARKEEQKKERAAKEQERSQRIEGRCALYIPRKQRYCRMVAQPGHEYCFEHFMHETKADARKRVICPYNPNHTAYEDQLEAHLEKCPSKEAPKPDYYQEHFNRPAGGQAKSEATPAEGAAPATSSAPTHAERISVSTVSQEELRAFIEKVRALVAAHLPHIDERTEKHPVVEEELARTIANARNQTDFKVGRHLTQQSSLIGHLHASQFLQPNHCFIEFGAGKAKYLHWISQALGRDTPATYIAVDRANSRNKFDKFLQKTEESVRFERLLIDIEHLVLHKAPGIREQACGPIVACSKHLCGVATDLSLLCLANYTAQEGPISKRAKTDAPAPTTTCPVQGISIALCCHQVCDYDRYCNPAFVTETLGLTPREFKLLTSMTSWAVCGTRAKKDEVDGEGAGEGAGADGGEDEGDEQHMQSTSERSGLSRGEQELLGWQCKRLIDAGRIKFLESHGFDVHLIKYVDKEVTLENILLHATRKQ